MIDYKSERDSLIEDITRLRAERDEYKRKLDDVVDYIVYRIHIINCRIHCRECTA
ncbi:hypothetical protein [Staphylococcus hyicus]|uniref:hypothetical protein n=1 Tax=Staphylococcus hyicus TaxID=1284 RepID=UPI0031335155